MTVSRVRSTIRLVVAVTALIGATTTTGWAQDARSSKALFTRLRTGDCTIRIFMPDGADLANAVLARNDNPTNARSRLVRAKSEGSTIQFRVQQPPGRGERFTVIYTVNGKWTSDQAVVTTLGPDRTSCTIKDDRGLFDPAILIGVSADGFAPNERENYPSNTDYKFKVSQIVRLNAQLRVGDGTGSWLDHLWLEAAMKYAVRSTDLDCDGADIKSPACDPNQSAFQPIDDAGRRVTANVLRASKIEGVFKPRYEFYTMRPDSELPVAIFGTMRFGFGQAPDEVKVENIYSAGVGFVFPSGRLRDSGFETTWGIDRGYRTNPDGVRTRMDFKLVVGSKPGIRNQIPFLRLGAMRALFEVVFDRNTYGPGPDGTQTFLGVVVDGRSLLQ